MEKQATVSVTDQIRKGNDVFETTFVRHDSDALSKLYTQDASLFPPGAGEQKGTQAIGQFWQGAMQMGVANVKLTSDEVEDHGNTAIEIGHFELKNASGDQLDHGRYLVVWKRKNDQWFLHKDIWNSSQTAG